MKEVSGPVVAIGLVLCAVFVPVAFMGGVTGQLYSQFALTIAVAVVFSVINALTLSPALSRPAAQEADAGARPDRGVLQVVQPVLRLAEHQLRQHRRRPGPQGRALHAAAGRGGRRASGSSASSCPAASFPTRTRAISSSPSSCPKARRSSAPTRCSSRWRTSWAARTGVRSAVGLAGYEHPQLAELPQRRADVRGPRAVGGAQDARAARQRPRPRVEQEVLRPSPARAPSPSARRRCRATATCRASPCSCRTAPAAASSNWPAT